MIEKLWIFLPSKIPITMNYTNNKKQYEPRINTANANKIPNYSSTLYPSLALILSPSRQNTKTLLHESPPSLQFLRLQVWITKAVWDLALRRLILLSEKDTPMSEMNNKDGGGGRQWVLKEGQDLYFYN